MFGKNKMNSFNAFYYGPEGKKMLALATVFLDSLHEKIKEGECLDVAFDYRFDTPDYAFKLIYSKRSTSNIKFIIYDVKEEIDRIKCAFSSVHGGLLPAFSNVYFVHKNELHAVYLDKYSLFHPLIEKIKPLVVGRYIHVDIPKERIEEAIMGHAESASEILSQIKGHLQANRSLFRKEVFPMIAHTMKTLEQTVMYGSDETHAAEKTVASELTDMIKRDLSPIFQEYMALSAEQRIAQEEKLLIYLHRFYLKALDVQENHKN